MKFTTNREKLLEVDDVAEHLKVGKVTIYRWCREGRMPCIKIGKGWRIRREALDEFIRQSERPRTLSAQLQQFISVPDNLIGICQSVNLMHALDATFFKVGESRGGLLVKFHGSEEDSMNQLREDFEGYGLEVGRLEEEGRFVFVPDRYPEVARTEALEQIIGEKAEHMGGALWASFDWTEGIGLEDVIRQQEELTGFVEKHQVVAKTAALEEAVEDWPPVTHRQAQEQHSGMIWLSEGGVALSRMLPIEMA